MISPLPCWKVLEKYLPEVNLRSLWCFAFAYCCWKTIFRTFNAYCLIILPAKKKRILLKNFSAENYKQESAVSMLTKLWNKYLILKDLNISAIHIGFNYKHLYTIWDIKHISKNYYSICTVVRSHTVIVYMCVCRRQQQQQTVKKLKKQQNSTMCYEFNGFQGSVKESKALINSEIVSNG